MDDAAPGGRSAAPQVQVVDKPKRRLYTVREAAESLSLSRASVYRLMDEGDIASVKFGRRRLIPADALDTFVESLKAAS